MAALVNDNSYFVVHAWMTTKLKLKGLERDLYAIIYGFSKDGESTYHGSIEYLVNLTGYSKQAIIPILKGLVDKKLLIREDVTRTRIHYSVNTDYIDGKDNLPDGKESLPEDTVSSKESLQNNIDYYNIKDNYSNSEENKIKKLISKQKTNVKLIEDIITYFNSVCGSSFKSTAKSAISCINARIKEGATYEDFIKVIDYKYSEWGLNPVRFSTGQMSDTYLRPSTLFGPKFDEYLQQSQRSIKNSESTIVSVAPLEERSKKVY